MVHPSQHIDSDPARDEMQAIVTQAFGQSATEVPTPVQLTCLHGAVPSSLRGVLLRNGPGRQERGGVQYGHPFDGDGFLQRLAFSDAGVDYTARFVQTQEFVAEESADRILYRGFGTNKPGGFLYNVLRLHFKNAANTSVVQHAGHTWWEGGLPHRIDPITLETLERDDLGGALRNTGIDGLVAPELPFSAHPSIDPNTGELWNFGTAFGRTNRLLVYRMDPSGTVHTRTIKLTDLPFVHDMALTPRFAVFLLPATRFDIPRALLGLKTPVASLSLQSAPGTLLLVPRNGDDVIRVPVSPGFVFHWGAAWEEGDTVVLDGVKYPGFPKLDQLDSLVKHGSDSLLARPVRFTVSLSEATAVEEELAPLALELPTTKGSGRDRVLYGTSAPLERGTPFLSGLTRMHGDDVLTRELYPDVPGEPLVCGDWLVVQVWRAQTQTSEVWVVDSGSLETVARLALPNPVPPALHGTWLPSR
jgi:all-trans-8'-apo-beta-carotenal 15,15'-oxygenase